MRRYIKLLVIMVDWLFEYLYNFKYVTIKLRGSTYQISLLSERCYLINGLYFDSSKSVLPFLFNFYTWPRPATYFKQEAAALPTSNNTRH